MEQTFDEQKMKKELLELYQLFLENPDDENMKDKLIKYDRHYGGLATYNDYFKSHPISEEIKEALGGLVDISLYGEGFMNKEECVSFAKKIIDELK